jgi:hypothetical protein
MSTLEVQNISDGTDTVETGYVVNGSAKVWCYLNGTGTIAIADSFNTASLTDLGTGDYAVNLTNSLSAEATHLGFSSNYALWAASSTGTSLRVATTNSAGALSDGSKVTATGYGELA